MTDAPEAGRARAARLASFRFLARFLVLLVVLYAIVASRPVNDAVIVPFTAGIASVSGSLLRALGEPAAVTGTLISGGGFSVSIENGCNGVETVILLVSAVLAFPASWAARGIGVALGFVAIEAVNLLRVISLFWVGRHHPALFQASHGLVWQSIVVLFGVLLFFLWAARLPRPAPSAGS